MTKTTDLPTASSIVDVLANSSDSGSLDAARIPLSAAQAALGITPLQGAVAALSAGQVTAAYAFDTWTKLSSITPANGAFGLVLGDSGTHTDPVTGQVVSNSGRYGYQTAPPVGWKRLGDENGAGAFLLTSRIVTSFASSVTDWTPTGTGATWPSASFVDFSATAPNLAINSLAGGSNGAIVYLRNTGTFDITIPHLGAGNAVNQFATLSTSSATIGSGSTAIVRYSAPAMKWTVIGVFAAAASNADAVAGTRSDVFLTPANQAAVLEDAFPRTARSPLIAAFGDANGYLASFSTPRGYDHRFTLSDCDTIVHFGDSLTDASYVLRNKAWISWLSAFSPYRHIDQAVSGSKAKDIYERLRTNRRTDVLNAAYTYRVNGGTAWGSRSARYAVIMDWGNDVSDAAHDPTKWTQNIPKIIEMVRAMGAEPVLVTEHFSPGGGNGPFGSGERNAILAANVAEIDKVDLVDVQATAKELGFSESLAFWEGTFWWGFHCSTRSGVIYSEKLIKWLDRIPKPRRSIKLYNLRGTVTASSPADLVFTKTYDLVRLFKEIEIGHRYFQNPEAHENKTTANRQGFDLVDLGVDHYNALQTGATESLTSYALLRISVPTEARSLKGVGIEVGMDPTTQVYLLDRYAVDTADTWNVNAAWVPATYVNRMIRIDGPTLARCMNGNELYVLLYKAGGVTVTNPIVHYSALDHVPAQRIVRTYKPANGTELLTKRDCASLSGWTVTGSPALLTGATKPFDLDQATLRDPYTGPANGISGVIEVTSANKIAQSIAVTAGYEKYTTYRIRVWARFWPKVYLDNSQPGFGFPADQVVDKSIGTKTFAVDSPINFETFDYRLLTCEASFSATAKPVDGFCIQEKMVGPYWSEEEFVFSTLSSNFPGYLNFRLSSSDGVVQIGKLSMMQVIQYEHRV